MLSAVLSRCHGRPLAIIIRNCGPSRCVRGLRLDDPPRHRGRFATTRTHTRPAALVSSSSSPQKRASWLPRLRGHRQPRPRLKCRHRHRLLDPGRPAHPRPRKASRPSMASSKLIQEHPTPAALSTRASLGQWFVDWWWIWIPMPASSASPSWSSPPGGSSRHLNTSPLDGGWDPAPGC